MADINNCTEPMPGWPPEHRARTASSPCSLILLANYNASQLGNKNWIHTEKSDADTLSSINIIIRLTQQCQYKDKRCKRDTDNWTIWEVWMCKN